MFARPVPVLALVSLFAGAAVFPPVLPAQDSRSPDGERIAFVSDRTGAQNLWIAEVGKKADLQVLERDPLSDIRNTTSIRRVMKNGRLYEAATLTEIWPRQTPLARLWWETSAVNAGAQ